MKHRLHLTLVLLLFVQGLALLHGCSNSESEVPGPGATGSTAAQVLNLTPDFITLEGVDKDTHYKAGSTLTLTLTPGETLASGFSATHMEHIHIHVNDAVYIPTFPATGDENVQSLTVDITVPDSDFEVVACYSVQQQMVDGGHTMFLEENPSVKLYGVSPDRSYRYFDCYLLTTDAYTITGIEFRIGNGEWQPLAETTGCSFTRSALVANVYQVTVRPDYADVTGDVTLRVSGEQHARHTITWQHAEESYLDLEKSTLPAESIDGEQVTAELWVKPDYYLASAAISAQGVEPELIERVYVRFKMPAEEGYKPMRARIASGETFTFKHYAYEMYRAAILIPESAAELAASVEVAQAYTVSTKNDISFDDGTLYAEGETVSMAIYVPDGERITSVKATDAKGHDLPVTLNLPYASFVMPASDVSVEVTYEQIGTGSTVSVIAYYDADTYDVYSSTNYDWDFAEGFTMERGATFYLSVSDYEGSNFYVGVKIGDTVTVYPADFDDMMGGYSFGKALVADGDVVIKVGATEDQVAF